MSNSLSFQEALRNAATTPDFSVCVVINGKSTFIPAQQVRVSKSYTLADLVRDTEKCLSDISELTEALADITIWRGKVNNDIQALADAVEV